MYHLTLFEQLYQKLHEQFEGSWRSYYIYYVTWFLVNMHIKISSHSYFRFGHLQLYQKTTITSFLRFKINLCVFNLLQQPKQMRNFVLSMVQIQTKYIVENNPGSTGAFLQVKCLRKAMWSIFISLKKIVLANTVTEWIKTSQHFSVIAVPFK